MGSSVHGQYLVNLQTSTATGAPDPALNWSASVTDAYGYLFVIGNTQTLGANGVDVLLTCYDPDDLTEIVWQETYHRSGNTNDYGVDLVWDPNGSIVFVAASFDDTLSDYWVVKVNSTDGSMDWSEIWDSEDDDIPTDLILDGDGNVFVTGSARVGSSSYDVTTIKLNLEGGFEWSARYDGAGLIDVGAHLSISGERLLVTGGQSLSGNEWDYLTLEYDMTTGSEVDVNTTSSLFPLEQPKAVARDVWGNTFICGAARTGISQQWDWHIVALDTAQTVIWETTWDAGDGLGDRALTLVPNDSGGVYVGGYSSRGYGKEFTVVKFDDEGHVDWHQALPNEAGRQGQCKQLSKNYLGEVIAAGEHFGSTTGDIVGMGYAADGDILWYKQYATDITPGAHPLSLSVGSTGDVWITGVKSNTSGTQYRTLKYSFWDTDIEVVNDSTNAPSHVKGEVILRFDPNALILDKFLNKDILFGKANTFITGTVLDSMEAKLGISGLLGDAIVEKVFPRLTPADTLSITRLGDTIRIPDFWTTLVLNLPNVSSRSALNEVVAADSLSAVKPDIWWTQLNYLLQPDGINLVPDDPGYTQDQLSLREDVTNAPDFVNGDINIEDAWDITTGDQAIRVGVYDDGIYWQHEDFDLLNTGGATVRQNSRVTGGYDYTNSSPIVSNPVSSHGTACAGIIGASTNNSIGVAGIAGGDYSQTLPNTGIRLFDMRMIKAQLIESQVANAIIEGALHLPQQGGLFGLDVSSHSYGENVPSHVIFQAVEWAFKNQMVVVASRGNSNNGTYSNTIPRYPGSFEDSRAISVGASGHNGELLTPWTNNPNISPPNNENPNPLALGRFGEPMDLVAPGSDLMVATLGSSGPDDYRNFFGSSAAVPHVAGVAALMLSYANSVSTNLPNPLAPEDVEQILERTASDRGIYRYDLNELIGFNAGIPYPGYDQFTGWGLLDATAALEAIQFPEYQVLHISVDLEDVSFTETRLLNEQEFRVNEDFEIYNQSLPKDRYQVDV
jgi:hypothetical protein